MEYEEYRALTRANADTPMQEDEFARCVLEIRNYKSGPIVLKEIHLASFVQKERKRGIMPEGMIEEMLSSVLTD